MSPVELIESQEEQKRPTSYHHQLERQRQAEADRSSQQPLARLASLSGPRAQPQAPRAGVARNLSLQRARLLNQHQHLHQHQLRQHLKHQQQQHQLKRFNQHQLANRLQQRQRSFQKQQQERRRSQRLKERINYNLEFKFKEQEQKRLEKASSIMLSKMKQAAALSAAAAGSASQASGQQQQQHEGAQTRSHFGQIVNSTHAVGKSGASSASSSPTGQLVQLARSSSASSDSTSLHSSSDNEDTTTTTNNNNNNHNNDTNGANNNSAEPANEQQALEANDDNNNNQSKLNNNNNEQQIGRNSAKKSQEQLIDIVEVSRKRRLSKDSADSLGSFIRWSFSHHLDEHSQQRGQLPGVGAEAGAPAKQLGELDKREATPPPLALNGLDEEDQWAALNLLSSVQRQKQLQQQQDSSAGASAADLAPLRSERNSLAASNLAAATNKRARLQVYSPEARLVAAPAAATSPRKVYLGSVVERLHAQQQQRRLEQQQQQQRQQDEQEAMDQQQQQQNGANSGLSLHLQQFLAQQSSLEDLCSSVGLDDGNQLVLAAAIHRALVDSAQAAEVGGGGGGQQQQLAAEPTGAPKSTGSASSSATSSSSCSAPLNRSGANLHLAMDSLASQRRPAGQLVGPAAPRGYNTRAALQGLALAAAQQEHQHQQRVQGASAAAAALAAMNSLNQQQQQQQQQQRHAQAAAALSALAGANSSNVGSFAASHQHHLQHHQQHLHHLASGAAGADLFAPAQLQAGQQAGAASAAGPMVDFECDTCGSSFDDRHRLMQHQSIHLELKKDWFQETPVDEVMKIFNRRRGEFLCNTCNLRFEATFDYDKHNHQVHGQRPYCCQFCGNGTRTFRFWRQYLNHLYDHRYIFSCTIDDCDFTVNRRDSLRFHIFRFHLNCQLPQQQTSIRSAGQPHQQQQLHSNNNNNNHLHHNMLLGDLAQSKWPHMLDDEQDDDANDLDMTND